MFKLVTQFIPDMNAGVFLLRSDKHVQKMIYGVLNDYFQDVFRVDYTTNYLWRIVAAQNTYENIQIYGIYLYVDCGTTASYLVKCLLEKIHIKSNYTWRPSEAFLKNLDNENRILWPTGKLITRHGNNLDQQFFNTLVYRRLDGQTVIAYLHPYRNSPLKIFAVNENS